MMKRLLRHSLPILAIFAIPVVAGLVAWPRLPVELLPSLKYPRLAIITSFGNASAEEVESLLTRPVEEAVGTVSGLRSMTSVSAEGISSVILRFDWGSNISLVAAEVREKLDLIADTFPREVKLPIVEQYDPAAAPVISVALTGSTDLASLYLVAKDSLKPELETVQGVANVRISGGLTPEVHVLVDQGRLRAQSVDLRVLADRLETANINFPGGSIIEGHLELPVRTVGRFKSLDEISLVAVGRGEEGGVVRLRDLAEVQQSHKDRSSICRWNGEPSVLLGIVKEPSANTVEVCRNVMERLPDLAKRLPKDSRLELVDNEAPLIENALKGLRNDIIWGSCLAFGILLGFLRSVKSAGLIIISIPISVVSTCAFMSFAGITLNLMSIGGMALGVGMLLDCSIVVLEAIHRKRETAGDWFDASVLAVNEVGPSVVSGTLTTVAVLLPILFMTGVAQRLFRDFAFTMGVSVMMSLLVSLFLLPAVAAARSTRGQEAWKGKAGSLFLETKYRSALSAFSKRPSLIMVICGILCVVSACLLYRLGFELFPHIDVGRITMKITLPPDSSMETVEGVVRRVELLLRECPETESILAVAGFEREKQKFDHSQMIGQLNEAMISVKYRQGEPAARSGNELIEFIRKQSAVIVGQDVRVHLALTQGPLTRILGDEENRDLLRLVGDDLATLNKLAEDVAQALRASPLLTDISTKGNTWIDHFRVTVDRDKAAGFGVSVEGVADAVSAAIEGKTVGKFLTGDREQDIRIRLRNKDRTTLEELFELPLLTEGRGVVSLDQISDIEKAKGPREILRHERRRNVEFLGNVVGTAISKGEDAALKAAGAVALPDGYYVKPGVQRMELSESMGSLVMALALSVGLVYAILVIQFESLLWPLIVLTAVPFTIVGPAAALSFSGKPINVLVLIGAIVLVGIVVNMAILMVATMNDLRKNGMALSQVVIEGPAIRLRPILMTTLTTALGALPVALSQAGMDQINKPLAVTLIAGLIASAVYKIFGLPLLYQMVAESRPASWTNRGPEHLGTKPCVD